MVGFELDATELKTFARNLRAADPVVARHFGNAMKGAGELVATEARRRADFSSRIPSSIRVRRSGVNVTVIAGGAAAPHAAALDHGGEPGSFRHPVFGDTEVWVDQPAEPFLEPAGEEKQEAAATQIANAIDQAVEELARGT